MTNNTNATTTTSWESRACAQAAALVDEAEHDLDRLLADAADLEPSVEALARHLKHCLRLQRATLTLVDLVRISTLRACKPEPEIEINSLEDLFRWADHHLVEVTTPKGHLDLHRRIFAGVPNIVFPPETERQ